MQGDYIEFDINNVNFNFKTDEDKNIKFTIKCPLSIITVSFPHEAFCQIFENYMKTGKLLKGE